MNALMAPFDRGKHIVPLTLDVRAVCVKLMLQSSFLQYLLALSYVLAYGYTNAHRDDTQIYNYFHLR
jgi:hypothetical protein